MPFSMVRQTLWFPGEPREVSVRPRSLVLRHLRHSQQKPIRRDVPFRLIKNAAALSWERAKRRGAKIYAEVVGYGCSSDAYHITSPAEDGSGAARAMLNAVWDAGIAVDEVNYINAHGTSTHHNDLFETRAIKLAFGAHAGEMKVNSTKSMVGHMLGAAGAIEFITCVKEIEEDYIHATVGYKVPDEELDLDYCKEPVSMEVQYALSNSLGFGGHNASILLKKYTIVSDKDINGCR